MSEGNRRVILVDDDRDVLELLSLVVARLGVSCETAATGEEAVELMRKRPADLLILDKNLPGIDGLEAARRARELQPGIPIALVTGYESDESRRAAAAIGIDDYIRKPIDLTDFRTRIGALLPAA
ncbi:MAG TPA: response regulator [Phycisphaerae bacterium]|nr:response regulator [Phycisphaerae bacterium]